MPIFDSRPSLGGAVFVRLQKVVHLHFNFRPLTTAWAFSDQQTPTLPERVAQSPAGVGLLQAFVRRWTFQLVAQAWTSSLPGLWGLGPAQCSEHHYSRMLYLKMRSINPSHSDWTLVSARLLFFPLVNPQEHLSAGTGWYTVIVWCQSECSLSCFSTRSRDR